MLLRAIEKHLRDRAVAPATFGRDAVGDPSFVFELRRGREPRLKTMRKVRLYMDQPTSGSKGRKGATDARP